MGKLSSETIKLLDKVYNLRGSDSSILLSLDKDIDTCANVYDETSTIKDELQKTIHRLESDVEILSDEGEKLKNFLSGIDENDYTQLLETLDIDFHPTEVKEKLDTLLPITVNGLASDIKMSSNELSRVESKLEETRVQMEELNIRKEEALGNQNRLNHYFELALDSNINVTREELTSLFSELNFSEEEARECAKLLMFPEDGLFEYENKRQDKPITGKSISEVIQEAKETPFADLTEDRDKAVSVIDFDAVMEPPKNETHESVVEIPIVEPPANNVHTKEELIDLLTRLGFDYLDFANNDFAKILANYNEKVLTKNVAIINDLNINKDVFNDNVELFYDEELESKIKKLTSVGKMPKDIYLNPNVLIKYNLNELENAINVLNESGLDPKNVPLMAY